MKRLPNQKNISQSLPHLTSLQQPALLSTFPSCIQGYFHPLLWSNHHAYADGFWIIYIWLDLTSKLQSRIFFCLQNVCLDAYRFFKLNVFKTEYFIPLFLTLIQPSVAYLIFLLYFLPTSTWWSTTMSTQGGAQWWRQKCCHLSLPTANHHPSSVSSIFWNPVQSVFSALFPLPLP